MENNYISLLIQIPLVGIFVWFSLTLIKIFMQYLERLEAKWETFLDQQAQQNHEAIAHMAGRFADEIKALSKEIAEMRGKINK